MARNKAKKNSFLKLVGKGVLFLIKIPYYLLKGIYLSGRGIYNTSKKIREKIKNKRERKKVLKKRELMIPKYENFSVLKEDIGNYSGWEKSIYCADSKIGIILGARGAGKSAFGIKFLENLRANNNKKCFAMGFKESEMPSWIKVIQNLEELENNSFVLIDEGGILFSSRNSMSNANKLLSELILVARHKNLNILFISQNSSNLDVNVLRQADFLVLKPSSLLQKDFERKIVQKIYEKAEEDFTRFRKNKGLTYIYASNFKGFVSNPLPSFWGENLSKSFR